MITMNSISAPPNDTAFKNIREGKQPCANTTVLAVDCSQPYLQIINSTRAATKVPRKTFIDAFLDQIQLVEVKM